MYSTTDSDAYNVWRPFGATNKWIATCEPLCGRDANASPFLPTRLNDKEHNCYPFVGAFMQVLFGRTRQSMPNKRKSFPQFYSDRQTSCSANVRLIPSHFTVHIPHRRLTSRQWQCKAEQHEYLFRLAHRWGSPSIEEHWHMNKSFSLRVFFRFAFCHSIFVWNCERSLCFGMRWKSRRGNSCAITFICPRVK